MKKKVVKIIAAVTALLLIVFILIVYNAFCGNIFSAMYAKGQIEKYIDENYPGNNYEISDASFNFKFNEYNCQITDPKSQDGSFVATYQNGGNITDNYDNVTNLDNTLYRLEDGFRKDIDPILDTYLSEDEKEFGFGTLIGSNKETDKSKLVLDMDFDTKNMPLDTYVVASFNLNSEKSLVKIKEIARDLKSLGYRIDYYSFSNDQDYFDEIPTQTLLDATEVSDLMEYKLSDEIGKKD